VHEAAKASVAQFTAADIIDKREDVRAEIEVLLKEKLVPYNIVVEQVSIVSIDFSPQFNAAIDAKVTAQQLKEKAVNDLARITVEAEQVRMAAEGQRDAAIALATGESTRVRLVQQQLSQSPQYVEYIKAQKWNGAYPQFLVMGSGGGANFLMSLPSSSSYVPISVPMNVSGNATV
jgi:regulator of protease activity HflC (stomatin/prohibitin superfamily)